MPGSDCGRHGCSAITLRATGSNSDAGIVLLGNGSRVHVVPVKGRRYTPVKVSGRDARPMVKGVVCRKTLHKLWTKKTLRFD